MINFDMIIEQGDWPNEAKLHTLCEQALSATIGCLDQALPDGAEVSLLFTDNTRVQELNCEWRGQDKPTNVLSFAGNEGGGPVTPLLGDIILAHETVAKEAKEQNKCFDHHLTHLLIHGFLHLLGYDHVEDDQAAKMETLEIRILLMLGIHNPYVLESATSS